MDSALRIVTATGVGFSIMKKPCVRRENRIETGHLLAMRRTLALLVLTGAIGALRAEEQSSSPYATAADFAKCALPYNDVTHGQFKPEAPLVIPWFKQAYMGQGQSVCWHRWISIRKGNRTCYAQWEDCGPFRTDHFQYVFGNERPKPNLNHGAGLDVSPAVRDYLGLAPTDVTDWQFVDVRDVLPGPWRSYGENNHFVIARSKGEQRVVQQGGSSG